MKGIPNRQKSVVKAREDFQKFEREKQKVRRQQLKTNISRRKKWNK